jgi:hypothetical protein
MRFKELKSKLLESRADYKNLFNPILAIVQKNPTKLGVFSENSVNGIISSAKRSIGPRYNYLMYFLKMSRARVASDMMRYVSDVKDRKILSDIIENSPRWSSTSTTPPSTGDLRNIENEFKHFLSYDYEPINKYVPSKPYLEVRDDLSNLESEYHEKNVDDETRFLELQEGDKIFREYPDGFVWIMLNRHSCRAEADAMGHCGNVGGDYNHRILSLRKKEVRDGETLYVPYLTFIYNPESKLLGERKARFNEKPAKRYHPYILDLLRMDMVQGMEPEGNQYAPENNFQYEDLSDEQREKLFKEKPILSVHDGAKLSEFTEDMKDMVEKRIVSNSGNSEIFYDKEKNKILTTIDIEYLISGDLIKYMHDSHGYNDFGYLYNDDYLSNFSSLNMKNTEILYKSIKKAYDDSDHDKEDFDDFPEFSEFNRELSRGNLVGMIEEVGLDDNDEISEIISNLKSMLVGMGENEYYDFLGKRIVKNMPDLDGENFTFTFVGFANKDYSKTREVFDYFYEDAYWAIYETDRLVTHSDIIYDIAYEAERLGFDQIEDTGWYPDFKDINEYFSDYFEHEVKED